MPKINYFFLRHMVCLSTVIALAHLSSCGSKSDSPAAATVTAEATYDSLWTNVFSNRCGLCHGVTDNSKTLHGPDMRTKDSFYSNLVSVKGSKYNDWDTFQENRNACNTFSFIAPSDASNSLVVAILDDTVTPCTVSNHRTGGENVDLTAVSVASVDSLKKWINAGATK